jgi:hypothetical protein
MRVTRVASREDELARRTVWKGCIANISLAFTVRLGTSPCVYLDLGHLLACFMAFCALRASPPRSPSRHTVRRVVGEA